MKFTHARTHARTRAHARTHTHTHRVEFGKQYISSNGICACCVGKHTRMLETVQVEDWEKCWLVSSTVSL